MLKSVARKVSTLKQKGSAVEFFDNIREAARQGKLVVVFGTGSSIALTEGRFPQLSWRGLIQDGFAYALEKGKMSSAQVAAWSELLDSNDMDELLGSAEFVGRKLEGPIGILYARWLERAFAKVCSSSERMSSAIRAVVQIGTPIATLNFDTLLEEVTDLTSLHMNDPRGIIEWMQRDRAGVFHLHGVWSQPDTCVLGIRDYHAAINDDARQLIQRALASFSKLLFVGCGDTFADPNFSALVQWLRKTLGGASIEHYALVSKPELSKRNEDPTWHGFLQPICYGGSHEDLPTWLAECFGTLKGTSANFARAKKAGARADNDAIRDYLDFLLRDCGQMTIEGVRADIDTAQRRFDLERLFVPLKIDPVPPEIPDSDPRREEKLQAWREENPPGQDFGPAFERHRRLALLALPGGGKTLLLKRLAVAYADPSRRSSSTDALPSYDLMPLLIRCREWRGQMHLPIMSIIGSLAVITGVPSLNALGSALLPLLREGRVLLLVDGLDEIHSDSDRALFVESLEKFLNEFPKIHFVVTSREAGFDFIAPVVSQFCTRWRVAPLDDDAIRQLCSYWHKLMVGDTPEVDAEAEEVAERLLETDSLIRLAENPLLLTMLLVVKHGAGRLPPDRVSLYDRAVEVLLDTWNVKGHEALNLKEAVPQLACVAFELMRQGKQTATELQLLEILELARDKVPQIRRYARGTPYEFLKRVELRSSLVLEAGHQLEGARAVPFYQFRHLTFQEYLAAVAAVEGHYLDYSSDATAFTPLQPFLTAEEWKEVVPMAAVLARKQAEPIMASLVAQGEGLREEWLRGNLSINPGSGDRLPSPIARLLQCLIEEAEASPETLSSALRLVVLFACGCLSSDDWPTLARGPYGEELLQHAFEIYKSRDCPSEAWIRNTVAVLASLRRPRKYWMSLDGGKEIKAQLTLGDDETVMKAVLTVCGLLWGEYGGNPPVGLDASDLEPHFFSPSLDIVHPAIWAWALWRERTGNRGGAVSTAILDRLGKLWLEFEDIDLRKTVGFAFSTVEALASWKPSFSSEQAQGVAAFLQNTHEADRLDGRYAYFAAFALAYLSKEVLPEAQLREIASEGGRHGLLERPMHDLLGASSQ